MFTHNHGNMYFFLSTVLSFIVVLLIHLVAQVVVWIIYFVSVVGSIGEYNPAFSFKMLQTIFWKFTVFSYILRSN